MGNETDLLFTLLSGVNEEFYKLITKNTKLKYCHRSIIYRPTLEQGNNMNDLFFSSSFVFLFTLLSTCDGKSLSKGRWEWELSFLHAVLLRLFLEITDKCFSVTFLELIWIVLKKKKINLDWMKFCTICREFCNCFVVARASDLQLFTG